MIILPILTLQCIFVTTNFIGKTAENDQDGISWTRSEYADYVSEKIQEIPVVTNFSTASEQPPLDQLDPSDPVPLLTIRSEVHLKPRKTRRSTRSARRSQLDSRNTWRRQEIKKSPQLRKLRLLREKFNPSQCQKERKTPPIRLLLQKHPTQPVPLLRLTCKPDLLGAAVNL